MKRSTRLIFVMTALLLLVAASRIMRIGSFPLDNDEVWTIWQTFGAPDEIIRWTSPTETPLYILLLGAWKSLVGMHPELLRTFSLLLALPGVALMYRAARRDYGAAAGVLAALAYSALAIMIFLNLYTRNYALAYPALPLLLWAAQRCLRRPGARRSLPLVLALVLLYGTNVTAAVAVALVGLYLLLRWRGRILYLWLPTLIALLLVLPDVLANKLPIIAQHAGAERLLALPPLPQAWFAFVHFMLSAAPLWYALALLAAGGLLAGLVSVNRAHAHARKTEDAVTEAQRGAARRLAGFWLAWVIAVPLLLYALEARLGFYTFKRYGWWYGFGLALFIGIGLAGLPRRARAAGAALMLLILVAPIDSAQYAYLPTPLGENLRWLRDHYADGDALLLDPALECHFPEEWEYYTLLYFPQGLRVVESPDAARRLWYAASLNEASRAFERELAAARVPGRFVGPPGCHIRLYEAPPDAVGVEYENGMRFLGAEVMQGDRPRLAPFALREGQSVRLRLWWSVSAPPPLDYSVGLFVRHKGRVIAQDDSAPQLVYPPAAPRETSRWLPGQLYVEERELRLPFPLNRGSVEVFMALYWFGDGVRLNAPGVNAQGLRQIAQFSILAW